MPLKFATGKISKDMMRQMNQKLILRLIKEQGSSSKTELAKLSGLTLPAVSDILHELERYGLIEILGPSRTKRGRFPTLYRLSPSSCMSIGITIRSESIKAAVMNPEGKIADYLTRSLPAQKTPSQVIRETGTLFHELMQKSGIGINQICGIGLGMHGIVDPERGLSVYPPHLHWENAPMSEMLEKETGVPVLMDNDCNILAVGEYLYGGGRQSRSFIALHIDYGIGAGIMLDGKVFHGSDFGAGQIGHTSVRENGLLCSCGNYGCLETLASEPALIREAIRRIKAGTPSLLLELAGSGDRIKPEHLYEAAALNDGLATDILTTAARDVGISVSTLVNLFNPEKIIVHGGFLRGREKVLQPLEETVRKHALKTNSRHLEIIPSPLGEYSDVVGAAALWFNELFNGRKPVESFQRP